MEEEGGSIFIVRLHHNFPLYPNLLPPLPMPLVNPSSSLAWTLQYPFYWFPPSPLKLVLPYTDICSRDLFAMQVETHYFSVKAFTVYYLQDKVQTSLLGLHGPQIYDPYLHNHFHLLLSPFLLPNPIIAHMRTEKL